MSVYLQIKKKTSRIIFFVDILYHIGCTYKARVFACLYFLLPGKKEQTNYIGGMPSEKTRKLT